MQGSIPRVAILISTATSWGRGIIAGINRYVKGHGPWHLLLDIRSESQFTSVQPGWKGDGVIARVDSAAMARDLKRTRLPTVNVSAIRIGKTSFPRVATDIGAAAELAVEHFLNRGFHHFGYFSLLGLSYVADQQQAFMRRLKELGFDCTLYRSRGHRGAFADWNLATPALVRWLRDLPKPVGIYTWNTFSGRQIIDGCQEAGLTVPEEVAVLSGTDDELLCEVGSIPLSGVQGATEQVGYEAAEVLGRLMGNPGRKHAARYIPPLGVATRQSTDTLAIKEKPLVDALRFIRDRAHKPIQVLDVMEETHLSRRSLERLFRQVLNRTPAQEIRRVHFERSKKLLVDTDMAEPDVASAAGFGSPEYMVYVFKKNVGMSPIQFRKHLRGSKP